MSDTLTAEPFVRVTGSDNAPACLLRSWLPDGDFFPELTEARETYFRLEAAWDAAGARRRNLQERLDADKVRRDAALRDAYVRGDADPQPEAEDEALKAELATATEQTQAAARAYLQHINDCIALVLERRHEWQGEITAFEANLDAEVQALVEQARDLRAKRGHYGRLEHWLQRVADGAEFPAAHLPYSEIPAPPSGDPAEEDASKLELMLRSYAGGLAPIPPISEEQGEELERDVLDAPGEQPLEDVGLAGLPDDELVDFLMGCGRWDKQPKPGPSAVVAAAEGDPTMARRLLEAERVASGENPRADVVASLNRIVGAA
jgi:hypothetical protein